MKYLLLVLTVFTLSTLNAQKFEWNTKSATVNPKEVQPNDPARQAYDKAYNERQLGMAGIYNPNAQGTRTQYGETYNGTQLTASHPLLPLGTIVRVQNLDNNRLVSVRINDRGQECQECLLMLSQAAATQLGINYRGRVSVERTGFSNWNPALPAPTYNAPTAYNNSNVARPVEINRNDQWQARGNTTSPNAYGSTSSPLAYGDPASSAPQSSYNRPNAYGTPAQGGQTGNYAVLSAPGTPSVMSREVQPATVSRQPATYSRYPTAVTPTSPTNAQPRSYQPAARTYNQQPTYQQPSPVPATRQASPPNSTVARYQDSRTVPAPTSYNTPAVATPQAYSPPTGMTARGVAEPTAATNTSSASGYVVQLGAYNNELYAKNRVGQLKQMGLSNVFYRTFQKPDGQIINRVYAGTFTSMVEAQTASRVIQGNYQIAGIVSKI